MCYNEDPAQPNLKKKKDSRNRNGVWLILAVKEFTRKVWVAHTVPRRLEKQAW